MADFEGVCAGLYCHIPSNIQSCTSTTPPDFTSCATGKWCVSGACVEDSNAPSLPCQYTFIFFLLVIKFVFKHVYVRTIDSCNNVPIVNEVSNDAWYELLRCI